MRSIAKATLIALAFLTTMGAVSMSALGQGLPCQDRDFVIEHLTKRYQEVPTAIGVTNTGGLIEVLTSAGGDTWTIILSMPDGQSCLISSGEGWRTLPPKSLDPKA